MVAVTILLALLVIAAFVFGMAGNIQKTKVVAAAAAQSGNDIIVTYQGGQDAATVTQLKVILVDDNVIRTITAPLLGMHPSMVVEQPGEITSLFLPSSMMDRNRSSSIPTYNPNLFFPIVINRLP